MIDGALWFLLALRVKGALRKAGRQLRTKKGIAMSLLGLAIFAPMLLPVLLMPRMTASVLATTRQIMPIFLLAYCVLGLVTTSTGDRAILFNPAEIHFLFPAPFTQRQLLAYKVAGSLGTCLLTGAFMTLMLGQYAAGFLQGMLGLMLSLCFLQLFGMVVSLSASTIGVMAYNRRRKIVLATLGVVCVYALISGGADLLSKPPMTVWRTIRDSAALRIATVPFRPFAEIYTAERLWPDLTLWGTIGLAMNLAMIAVLFLLDARYLEAADAASERIYKAIERMRASGNTGMLRTPKKAGASLPMLPLWNGAGPIAWRQMMTARRDVVRLVLGLFMIGCMLVPIVLIRRSQALSDGAVTGFQTMMLGMGFLLSAIMTYDFRADYERMAELKALPIAPLPLTLGQLVTPIAVMSIVQWIVTAALVVLSGRLTAMTVGLALMALPINMISIAIDNLWFLLFPGRAMAPGSLDFEKMGQSMLMMLMKFTALALSGGMAAGFGYGVFYLSGGLLIPALATSWTILTVTAFALVPPIALAFSRFDVAADAPG